MTGQYNLRNPAVKRLMKEAQELREPTEQYFAQPLEDNLFEWHFTIRGPIDSEFQDGLYHGRIILPPEYPMKPPSIMLLTPNGRFETFKKICLSISGHHPESWQPSWSIRTALLAIIGFMPTHGNGAIGSLDYTSEERKVLAKKSLDWKCSECGSIKTILKPVTEASKDTAQEAKELASQISFQSEKEKNAAKKREEQENDNQESGAAASSAPTSESSAPDQSGAASPSQASTAMPGFPSFGTTYPGMMPNGNMNMPPFMSRMMTPPGSAPSSATMPRFMPPFWPGMMPPMPPTTTSAGPRSGMVPPRGIPPNPWPMMPPMMMYPQMMAMMAQQQQLMQQATPPTGSTSVTAASTSPTSTTSTPQTGNISNAPTPTTTTAPTPTPTPITQQPSSTPSVPVSSSPQPSAPSPSGSTPVSSAPSPAPTSTSSSSSTSPGAAAAAAAAAPSTSSSGLRQRTRGTEETRSERSGTSPAQAPPSVTPTAASASSASAFAADQSRGVRGENPFMVMAMALLGLAIIALLLRRLYNVWNAGAFDEF